MEDAELEYWEIQKHPSNLDEEDEGDDDNNNNYYNNNNSKLYKVVTRWMLNTGKKAVITGVVISSVPFVVPPLVVISALGFAFSVPFGFVFASYACTQKIMTKLLPPPPPDGFQDQYDEDEEEEDDDGSTAMELEEERMEEDLKRGVEMRINLLDHQVDEQPYYEKECTITDVDEGIVVPIEVEEVLEENDESIPAEICPAVVLDYNEQFVVEEGADAGESINESDIGVMEKETTTTESEEEEILVEEEEEERDDIQGINANNIVVVVMEPEAFADETTVLNNKFDVEMTEQVDHQDQRNVMVSNRDNGQATPNVLDDENMERGAGGVKSEAVSERNQERRNNQTDENAQTTIVGTHGDITKDNLAGNLDELDTLILKRKEDNVILSNADVRETADECGIYLFEETNAGFNTPQVNGVVKEKKAVENVDFLEFHSSIQAPDHNVKSVPQVDTRPPSTDQLYSSEEKIWEQIDAMRAIVGYKATPQPTCIAELKALYIFTGVEPPASFKADSDLHEVNDKLRFLMSIVGVK